MCCCALRLVPLGHNVSRPRIPLVCVFVPHPVNACVHACVLAAVLRAGGHRGLPPGLGAAAVRVHAPPRQGLHPHEGLLHGRGQRGTTGCVLCSGTWGSVLAGPAIPRVYFCDHTQTRQGLPCSTGPWASAAVMPRRESLVPAPDAPRYVAHSVCLPPLSRDVPPSSCACGCCLQQNAWVSFDAIDVPTKVGGGSWAGVATPPCFPLHVAVATHSCVCM
jgi:hypothetical protein